MDQPKRFDLKTSNIYDLSKYAEKELGKTDVQLVYWEKFINLMDLHGNRMITINRFKEALNLVPLKNNLSLQDQESLFNQLDVGKTHKLELANVLQGIKDKNIDK